MKTKWTDYLFRAPTYIALVLIILLSIFPAVWMFSTSIKQTTELYDIPPEIIPDAPTLGNYVKVLGTPKMYTAFLNSVIVTFFVVIITLALAILTGYGLARHAFFGSRYIKLILLFGQMIPGVVLIIPLYFLFTRLRLLDTLHALVIADLALTIPMGVVMLSAFFLTVPRELEEAAKIDGATELGALFRVILPIAKPGIVSVSIYTFIHAWEEFLFALNLSLSAKTRTLPIAISTFTGEFSVDWGSIMAASAIVAMPVLAIFLLCNRYFVKGLSEGAVKG
jgi:ABC-type glycerol-3-phosphate transport system permease component